MKDYYQVETRVMYSPLYKVLLCLFVIFTQASANSSTLENKVKIPKCKPSGYKFSDIEWDSRFSTKNEATQKIQSLKKTKQSSKQPPIKYCCSQTATANALHMFCKIPQFPLGKSSLPLKAEKLCAQPQTEYIVGYSWVCT